MFHRVQKVILAVALTLAVNQANANTYTDFNLSGIFTDPFNDSFPLAGILTVDGTTDAVTGASLKLAGESWTNIVAQGSSGGYYNVDIQTTIPSTGCSSNCFDTLVLGLSAPPSILIADGVGLILSGYAGLLDAGFVISLKAGTGSLIAVPSATPIPAALSLFVTGLGAIGLLGWRSKRKNAAAVIAT